MITNFGLDELVMVLFAIALVIWIAVAVVTLLNHFEGRTYGSPRDEAEDRDP